MHVAAAVAGQALEDGAVLGVDRQQLHAPRPRRGGHERAGHDQRLLVGKGDRAPGLDRRPGGQEPRDAAVMRGPAVPSVSLLARATLGPAWIAAMVGSSPAPPTSAETTMSAFT